MRDKALYTPHHAGRRVARETSRRPSKITGDEVQDVPKKSGDKNFQTRSPFSPNVELQEKSFELSVNRPFQ